jgi:hypothetical protein
VKPKVLSIESTTYSGAQRFISVKLDIDGEQVEMSFHGRAFGKPGPVTAIVDEDRIGIAHPERFGQRFNEEWVKSYFGEESDA